MGLKSYVFLTLCVFVVVSSLSFGEEKDVERRLDDIEHKVKMIDANQLNYQIEKDLLKETYSDNYKLINLFVTIVLGIVAVFGYFGLRDVSKIKDKYESELNELRKVKDQFDQKSTEFDIKRKKIDKELAEIITVNQEQSQKIKFIELKEKGLSLYKNKDLSMSLEFVNAALSIQEFDTTCLHTKGRILIRLNQPQDALIAYRKAAEGNPEDSTSKYNYVECLYFVGQTEEAESFVAENKRLFESKLEGELIEFFNVIKLYHESNLDGLKNIAKSYIQHDNLDALRGKLEGWDFDDAIYFAHYLPSSDLKTAIQNIIYYWANKIDGKTLLSKLELPLPEPPEENS